MPSVISGGPGGIGGIGGGGFRRMDPDYEAARIREKELLGDFDKIERNRLSTDAAKAVAKYGKFLLDVTHSGKVKDLKRVESIRDALSAATTGPVGAVIAKFALLAAETENEPEKSQSTLHWGFHMMGKTLPKEDPSHILAGLGWNLYTTVVGTEEGSNMLSLQRSLMEIIADFIPGPTGPIIARFTHDALSLARSESHEEVMLAYGFTSLLEGRKTEAVESPLYTEGASFVKKVGLPRARAIMKKLAESPGISAGSIIAGAVEQGLSSSLNEKDRELLVKRGISEIRSHPEARDYEKTLAGFTSGLQGSFPEDLVSDARQTLLKVLGSCKGGSQGRVISTFFEDLGSRIPHNEEGRRFMGRGFELILEDKSAGDEHRKAAEDGVALSKSKDLDATAAIEKMIAQYRNITTLPGNETERLLEAIRSGNRESSIEIEDEAIIINGLRLSVKGPL